MYYLPRARLENCAAPKDVCHGILDLLLSVSSASGNTNKTSPTETLLPFQSPRDQGPSSSLHTGSILTSELTHIKIRLRDNAFKRRSTEEAYGEMSENELASIPPPPAKVRRLEARTADGDAYSAMIAASLSNGAIGQEKESDRGKDFLGRDDVTVRFLWE